MVKVNDIIRINKTIQPSKGSESLTVAAAQQLSRRSFLKSVGALTLAIGFALKLPGQAQAVYISCTWRTPPTYCLFCDGPCSSCYSESAFCSWSGEIWYQAQCDCPSCQCNEFFAREIVCNDGSHKGCCPTYAC